MLGRDAGNNSAATTGIEAVNGSHGFERGITMASNVLDSELFKDYYGTERMRQIFSDTNQVQKWLDCEAALARVEANLGLIPEAAAREISNKAHAELIDLKKIKNEMDKTGHPFIALVKVYKTICEGDSGEYLHWGATSQDIMDTGMMLQIKEAYLVLNEKLEAIYQCVCKKAAEYRDVVMVGRTNGQQALPITLGFKFAVWGFELRRNIDRLAACKERLLVGEFAGAVGTIASLGERGIEVQEALFSELGLYNPPIAWFTARDTLAEFAATLALIATSLAKIGNEVYALQKTEIGELEEFCGQDSIGSSTMPHKRNPFISMQIVTLGKLIRSAAAGLMEASEQEHERDPRGMQAEWEVIPKICLMTDAALDKTINLVENIVVRPDKMRRNLELLHGLIFSEAIMLKLAEKMGRQTAHDVVHKLAMQAIEDHVPIKDLLLANPEIMASVTVNQLDELLDPKNYLGLAHTFVDRLTAQKK